MFGAACCHPGVFIFRFDAELNFTNKSFFKATLANLLLDRQTTGRPVRVVVLDLYGVHDIDASAMKMLQAIFTDLKKGKGKWAAGGGAIEVVVAGSKGPVRDMLTRGGVSGKAADSGSGLSALARSSSMGPPASTEEWSEAMQEVSATQGEMLCRQFVLLRTAVRYAVWKVSNGIDIRALEAQMLASPLPGKHTIDHDAHSNGEL